MTDPVLVFDIVFGIVACGGAVVAHQLRIFKRIQRVPHRRIGDLLDNQRARVIGTVREHDGVIEAGMTGRRCVFYRVQVTGTEPGKTTLKPLIDESRGVPFVVEDESGRAIVDPMDARVDLVADAWSNEHSFDGPTPRTDELLARHGFGELSHAWRSNLRMRESIICVGEQLTLVGFGVREGDPTMGMYREGGSHRLRMGGSVKQPLWMTKRLD